MQSTITPTLNQISESLSASPDFHTENNFNFGKEGDNCNVPFDWASFSQWMHQNLQLQQQQEQEFLLEASKNF